MTPNLDSDPSPCYDAPMPSNLCCCGCGESTARRFRPGHDARLKGRLIAAHRAATTPALRHGLARQLAREGWAHFLPDEALDEVPTLIGVGRCHRARSVHIRDLQGICIDESGLAHSRWFCPGSANPSTSRGSRWVCLPDGYFAPRPSADQDRWSCGRCIHTASFAEIVRQQRSTENALAGAKAGIYVVHTLVDGEWVTTRATPKPAPLPPGTPATIEDAYADPEWRSLLDNVEIEVCRQRSLDHLICAQDLDTESTLCYT